MRQNFIVLILIALAISPSVAAQEPGPALARFERAQQRYAKGDFNGAIADYTEVILLSTSRDADQKHPGRFDLAAHDSKRGTLTFMSPALAAAYAGRALARYRQGHLAEAIADCDRALSIHPGLAQVYINRGIMLWVKDDLDAALADFDRVIKMQPQNAQVYENRGHVLFDKGNLAAALADFEKAISLSPRIAAFYSSRGQVLQAMGQVDRGLADCDHAIAIDQGFARGFYCRATALYARKDFEGALAAFRKTIELDAGLAEAHGNLGFLLLQMGREEEAEKEFAECVRLDPATKSKLERLIQEARIKGTKE